MSKKVDSTLTEEEMINKLAEFIYDVRKERGIIWHLGIPNEVPITLSLRGQLSTAEETLWKWYPYPDKKVSTPEKASCCEGFSPGDEWKNHCTTLKHIKTMLRENYTGKDLVEQWQLHLRIIMIQMSTPELS